MRVVATERLETNSRARSRAGARFLKRAVDVTGAAIAMVLFAPVIGVLALLVKLKDGGPAIHRRRVVGLAGEFDAFKLRSMRVDADAVLQSDTKLREEFEANFKLKDDPRVTRVGAFLRKSSLDELPQLWNVLKGQMSLVGPRMVTRAELDKFGDAAWIFTRMKPGLTGYWQVSGATSATYEQRVAMEVHYVKNWSLLMDLKILAMTPARVIRGPRAC